MAHLYGNLQVQQVLLPHLLPDDGCAVPRIRPDGAGRDAVHDHRRHRPFGGGRGQLRGDHVRPTPEGAGGGRRTARLRHPADGALGHGNRRGGRYVQWPTGFQGQDPADPRDPGQLRALQRHRRGAHQGQGSLEAADGLLKPGGGQAIRRTAGAVGGVRSGGGVCGLSALPHHLRAEALYAGYQRARSAFQRPQK